MQALHLEVDRIFNGSAMPSAEEAESSEPAEQEKQVPSATEGKAPEKEALPESLAQKKANKTKGK